MALPTLRSAAAFRSALPRSYPLSAPAHLSPTFLTRSAASRTYATGKKDKDDKKEERTPEGSHDAQGQSAASATKAKKVPETTLAQDLLAAEELHPTPDEARAGSAGGGDDQHFPGETTGARSTAGKRSMSSIEKRRQMMLRVVAALAVGGLAGGAWHLGREWETDREKMEHENDPNSGSRFGRVKLRFSDLLDTFNKPAWDTLLPDLLPPPHQRPFTLLVDLEDLLIHSEWTRETGWRTAKRPGVDYFLAYLSQFYEIVLFTSQPAYSAAPIAEKLDPYGLYMPYKLFREATRFKDGKIVKDLSYLNRDLAKVIILDTKPEHYSLQPENAVYVKPWKGEKNDTELVALIPFLESIVIGQYDVKDVRPLLKSFEGTHVPTEYARREAIIKRRIVEQWEEEQKRKKEKPSLGGLGGLFGLNTGRPSASAQPPELPIEQMRKQFQQAYLEDQEYWKKQEPEMKRVLEEERQKQMQEMKSAAFDFFSKGVPFGGAGGQQQQQQQQGAQPQPTANK